MAQLTIYLNDEMLTKITRLAKKEKESVSAWVAKRLTGAMSSDWPAGYFETFGSLRNSGLKRPVQPDLSLDRKRETL